MTMRRTITATILALVVSIPVAGAEQVPSLPALDAALHETSVSGVSSGADMAHQLHIAHSSIMVGAGLVSVAPYHCAAGRMSMALHRCMQIRFFTRLHPATSLGYARTFERAGEIDPLANLADDRVYMFSGTRDETRIPAVVGKTRDLYGLLGIPDTQIHYRNDLPAGHAFLTEDWGNTRCGDSRPPFMDR